MNEAETRAEHIDPALAAAGWGVIDGSRVRREFPITPGRLEGHGRRGKLPEFFKDEAELRALWSEPDTRKKLLQGLSEKGFGGDQLAEMQKIIDAEKSDLFDVLAHVAYALPPVTREERAARAKVVISTRFNSKQQIFLDFVLSHYVSVGVEELDQDKLTPLLRLKYHNSIADAVADLGRPDEIGRVFAGFQKHLYEQQAVG
jgi:type I restriction enzyme R subunit